VAAALSLPALAQDDAAKRRELDKLRKELKNLELVNFNLDNLKRERIKVDATLAPATDMRQALDKYDGELAQLDKRMREAEAKLPEWYEYITLKAPQRVFARGREAKKELDAATKAREAREEAINRELQAGIQVGDTKEEFENLAKLREDLQAYEATEAWRQAQARKPALDREIGELEKQVDPALPHEKTLAYRTAAVKEKIKKLEAERRGEAEPKEPETKIELEVYAPKAEELKKPYESDVRALGLWAYLLVMGVEVRGLDAGLHCVQIDLDKGGRRYLWCNVSEKGLRALFVGDIPVPQGSFRMRVSMPEIKGVQPVTLTGTMKRSKLAGSRGELEALLGQLQDEKKALAKAPNPETAASITHDMSITLCQLAEQFHFLGRPDLAWTNCQRSMAHLKAAGQKADWGSKSNCLKIMAAVKLLEGDLAEVDQLTKALVDWELANVARTRQKLAGTPQAAPFEVAFHTDFANHYFTWANRLMVLGRDRERARQLWRTGLDHAKKAKIPLPRPPEWCRE
jgi:hypothetical protein